MMVIFAFSPSRKLRILKKKISKYYVHKDEIDWKSKNNFKSPYQQISLFLQSWNFTIDKNNSINDEKDLNTIKN